MPAFTGNGNDHMNINLVNLTESGISEGDEIGVFDGDICVGSVKIKTLNYLSKNNSISLPASSADGLGNKNGFVEGNPISVKLYKKGVEFPMKLAAVDNARIVFEKGVSLFAELVLVTNIEQIAGGNAAEINCYPNPFNEYLIIDINLAKNLSEINVVVLNQMGHKVKLIANKQISQNGLLRLVWDGNNENNQKVPPGIYYIKISVDDVNIYRKVVLSY